MKKKKPFNDYFNEFRTEFSNEKLFYPETFSNRRTKFTLAFMIATLVLFAIGNLLAILKIENGIGFYVMIVSLIPFLCYIFVIQNIRLRRELKRKGFPRIKNWFKWTSEELRDEKTKIVYKKYKKTKLEILERNISIAQKLISTPINNPFVSFEKFMDYSIKTIIGIFIGLLIFELNQDFTQEALNTVLKYVIGFILLYGILSFIWVFMFKRMHFEKLRTRKDQLREYVYVLENVVLLRLQKKKSQSKSNT
jgi:hypothetical protein